MLLSSRRDRSLTSNVLVLVINNIRQIMRKKIVFVLAVPLLFMISLVFLMSDIKDVPQNPVDGMVNANIPSERTVDEALEQIAKDKTIQQPRPRDNIEKSKNTGEKLGDGKPSSISIKDEGSRLRPPKVGERGGPLNKGGLKTNTGKPFVPPSQPVSPSRQNPAAPQDSGGKDTGTPASNPEQIPQTEPSDLPSSDPLNPPSSEDVNPQPTPPDDNDNDNDPPLPRELGNTRPSEIISQNQEQQRLEEEATLPLPIPPTPSQQSNPEDTERSEAVKKAYLHAWNSYEKYVFGHDELKPMSKSFQDWLNMGLTIVDSIDTMWIMGLTEEYQKARTWIVDHLDFDTHRDISVFETTIRVLGGLVSIYDLTGDKMYLTKAEQLANKLLPAFNTPTGIPFTTINLQSGRVINPQWAGGSSILSEAGTVQMEFSQLSKHVGNPIYAQKAVNVFDQLDQMNKPNGLYPVYINPHNGVFTRMHVTLGALGDSYYEYLLKMWLLTGKKEEKYRRMYTEAMGSVIQHLVKKSDPSGLTYIAEMDNGQIVDKMDHLVCFAGAMFALGAYHNATEHYDLHMELGKEITRTCREMYARQPTGLAPELVRFYPGSDFRNGANYYILRPETVESYFVLYWITQDPKYQEWGWEAFQAIEKHCKHADGYCGVRDVTNPTMPQQDDLQQSFFMAETLKYLYLLFAPRDTISLDKYVFNTEAHPLRIWE